MGFNSTFKELTTSCAFSFLVCKLVVFVVLFAQKYCFECIIFPSVLCLFIGLVNNVECLEKYVSSET